VIEGIEDIVRKTGEEIDYKPGLEVVDPDHLEVNSSLYL
jgi:hypothetical protein